VACDNGHEDIVTVLLEYGVSVHIKDKVGNTPLLIASSLGYEKIALQVCMYMYVCVCVKGGREELMYEFMSV